MKLPEDKIILFDLGGVILNINYEETVKSFSDLFQNSEITYNQQQQDELFDRYETGQISTMHFLNLLKQEFPTEVSIYQLTTAWNAMLGAFPKENIDFLLQLKRKKRIALLSNTNDLHASWFNRKLYEIHGIKLTDIFEKVYLSHEINKRKPNPETFAWVASQLNTKTENIFFTDDSVQHIEGAMKAGMSIFHYPQNKLLSEIFKI